MLNDALLNIPCASIGSSLLCLLFVIVWMMFTAAFSYVVIIVIITISSIFFAIEVLVVSVPNEYY
jgi:hypothetical protein